MAHIFSANPGMLSAAILVDNPPSRAVRCQFGCQALARHFSLVALPGAKQTSKRGLGADADDVLDWRIDDFTLSGFPLSYDRLLIREAAALSEAL